MYQAHFLLVKGVWEPCVMFWGFWEDSPLQGGMAWVCTPVCSPEAGILCSEAPCSLGGFWVAFSGLSWGTDYWGPDTY